MQTLIMTSLNLNIITTGLVGAVLAPVAWLATLPISVALIATMFTTLPASLLMARFGRRPIFIIGIVIAILAAALQGAAIFWQSYNFFVLASALSGVSMGVGAFYRYAAADAAELAHKPKALSMVMTGGLFAAFIGPEIAYRTPELIDGALFAGCYFAAAVVLVAALPIAAGLNLPKPDFSAGSGRPIGTFFKQSSFLLALIAAALGYAFMSFVMTATPLQVVNVSQLGIEANARVIQWHVIGMFAPSFFTGILISRFGVRPVLWLGAVLYVGCLALALSGTDFWHYFGALLFLGVGWNFLFIGGSSAIAACANPEERGRVQGVADFAIFTSVAIASLAAGVVHNLQGWQMLLQLASLPIAIIMVCLLFTGARKA